MSAQTALLVIDLQYDYFPGGKFPLWNAGGCKDKVIQAIQAARKADMPVVLIQHVADGEMAPFFVAGTPGVNILDEVRAAAPGAPVVVKHFADGFHRTELDATLQALGVTGLLICGMMTQNCVTFTALSKDAEKYAPAILTDCCTSVSEMLHLIALNALSTRVKLVTSDAVGCPGECERMKGNLHAT